ncbi:MAG TPA: hypothetical protein VHW69_02285 [Rhizomicrobium sp.]|jgi:hypothetical protein|nr:hypothetical protein [Rhizomicrobium sp.]
MDVDLKLQIQRPTRDASGNAIWRLSGALAGVPSIRFRDIVLLLLGGIFGGIVLGILASLGAYALTKPKFAAEMMFGCALWILDTVLFTGARKSETGLLYVPVLRLSAACL